MSSPRSPRSIMNKSTTNCTVSFTNDSSNITLEEEDERASPPLRSRPPAEGVTSPLSMQGRVMRKLSSIDIESSAHSDRLSPGESMLRPDPTFESNSSSDDSAATPQAPLRSTRRESKRTPSPSLSRRDLFEGSQHSSDSPMVPQHEKNEHEDGYEEKLSSILYIARFSVFGAVLRIYIARFFGLDCELDHEDEDFVDDFFTPVSSQVCVTASGRSEQKGGALFTDLPANMLGCFLVGLLTPTVQGHYLPWFRPDHPLQHHVPFITALRVGFCGSLTTFASWNTQMIVMLDGTQTVLGPQVVSALVGYLIGICCSVSMFVMGRHMHDWLRAQHSISSHDEENEEIEDGLSQPQRIYRRGWRQATSAWEHAMEIFGIRLGPLVLFCGLLAAFLVADFSENIAFYRRMWMLSLLAPVGALSRWKLSEWNNWGSSGNSWDWLPRGTLTANLLASILSALMRGLDFRLVFDSRQSQVLHPLLLAIETGFGGSLSTVSSMVGEMFCRDTPAQAHLYCFMTIISAMLLGLAVYCPIVRID